MRDPLHLHDLHREMASEIFQVPVGHVTPTMRREARAANFGVLYGGLYRETYPPKLSSPVLRAALYGYKP